MTSPALARLAFGGSRLLALALACASSIVSPLPIAADPLEQEPTASFEESGAGARVALQEAPPDEGPPLEGAGPPSGEAPGVAPDGCCSLVEPATLDAAPFSARGQQVLDRINGERAVRGLAPLMVNEQLFRAAARHSQEMARQSLMTHAGADGSNPVQRARAEGYSGRGMAEVVAMGFAGADQVVAAWMASPEHRDLLLAPRFREASIGIAESATRSIFWTADLGIPRD